MGRSFKSSGGRSHSGRGTRASSFKSSGFRGSSFKTGGSRFIGGYNHRTRPYRRNYFFHSLGRTGKIIYIVGIIILFLVLSFL